jgi:hypothetical protein
MQLSLHTAQASSKPHLTGANGLTKLRHLHDTHLQSPDTLPEDAHALVKAFICFSSFKDDSTNSLVTRDLAEVCTVTSWDNVALRRNPYPFHYRTAFAFFHHPMPALQRPSLRSACHYWRRNGFTVFRINNNNEGLGANCLPMVLLSSFGYTQKPKLTMLPFS